MINRITTLLTYATNELRLANRLDITVTTTDTLAQLEIIALNVAVLPELVADATITNEQFTVAARSLIARINTFICEVQNCD